MNSQVKDSNETFVAPEENRTRAAHEPPLLIVTAQFHYPLTHSNSLISNPLSHQPLTHYPLPTNH